jgi:hemerythrin-like domain-containing protein
MEALRVIRDEHRSLAAVLHGMRYVISDIRERNVEPHFALLRAMVYYIDAFPERFHHPKEDKYLFRLLALRYPQASPTLDRLHAEHRDGAEKIRTLEQALTRYQEGGADEFARFADAVENYAKFHWEHMRVEEDEVFPLAERYLTADDWKLVDEAFLGHSDPMLGAHARTAYHELFRRIVNLAPPPIGLGPERSAEQSSGPLNARQ